MMLRRLVFILVPVAAALATGCFNPKFKDRIACDLNGACPSGLSCSTQNICESTAQPIDAAVDASPDAPSDALVCYGMGLVKICFIAPPTAARSFSDSTPIDTSNPSTCATTVSGADNYCVIVATTISVDATLRATGAKPLVLIASDTITVAGTIDVGSHRGATPEIGAGADPAGCDAGTAPGAGGGGGAGASFLGLGGAGGTGGNGGTGGTPGTVAGPLTALRGGCSGQDGDGAATDKGRGGHGGGAVFLIAGTKIMISGGEINASGEGGGGAVTNASGGGGGGAGGMIGLDAPAIMSDGFILASGGGGGEGSGETTAGQPGAESNSTNPAPGGAGGTGNGGNGGDGSAKAATAAGGPGLPGNTQLNNKGGGGGGGGGAGLVKAPAIASLGANVSPPATP